MKRLALVVSIGFAFGAMCSGAPPPAPPPPAPEPVKEEPKPDPEIVVVPVSDDGGEHWCCAYMDGGTKKYAILKGPGECKNKYEDKEGAWTSGPECTPCCCKTPNAAGDASKGARYELTTPIACAGVGECLAGDAKECEGQEPEPGVRPGGRGGKAKNR